MSFLEKIRNKPHAQKVRLIWIVCIIVALVMAVVWVFTSKLGQNMPKDTSLFHAIKDGVKNLTK